MKALILSDFLDDMGGESIQVRRWKNKKKGLLNSNDSIVSLLSNEVAIIDMTINDNDSWQDRRDMLFELNTQLSMSKDFYENPMILIIVCGAPRKSISFDSPDGEELQYHNYDFLNKIIPGAPGRIRDSKFSGLHSVSSAPVGTYLHENMNNTNWIGYAYSSDSEDCVNVTPLARIKKDATICLSVECIIGRTILVLLPSYSIE